MRFVVYCRVSTSGQKTEGVSLEVQEATCRAFVERQAAQVVAVVKETQSGLNVGRPKYQGLFDMAESGSIDAVVVYRLDRLGRDAAEMLRAVRALQGRGVDVCSATEPTESRFVTGIFALLAEEESDRLRARTVPAQHARLREGKWLGQAPRGYRLIKAPDGRGYTLEPTDDGPKVARLFELYATGKYSMRTLRDEALLLGLGGPTDLCRTYLHRILRNPAYTGQVVWGRREKAAGREVRMRPRDEWHVLPGLHPALVDEETFAEVQRLLDRHRRARGPLMRGVHMLAGLLECSCGARMYPSSWRLSDGRIACTYCCWNRREYRTCAQRAVAGSRSHAYVRAEIRRTFAITRDLRATAADILAQHREEYMDASARRRVHIERSLAQHRADRRRLALDLVREKIPADLYEELARDTDRAISLLEAELAEVANVEVPDLGRAMLYVADMDWDDLDDVGWRDVANVLISRVEANGPELTITWEPEAEALSRVLKHARVTL